MNYQQVIDQLKNKFNFQSYGLEKGFDLFENRVKSCLDVIDRETFEWKDNSGNDVAVYVTIESTPVEFDEEGEPCLYETNYILFENQYGN